MVECLNPYLAINSLPPGKFFYVFCRLLIFFKINFFQKILSGIPSECQIDWIHIRPDIILGLIWVQSVCKGYQQSTQGYKEFIFVLKRSDFDICCIVHLCTSDYNDHGSKTH